jgi:release factor glutamine methyltransferase
MDWSQAQKELAKELAPAYGDREAAIIADWVMERLTGQSKMERLLRKTEQLGPTELAVYERYRDELSAGRPVQYVLGESWFGGMKFFVDERVLIPRPETDELVEWVISEASAPASHLTGLAASQANQASAPGSHLDKPAASQANQTPAPASILDVGTGSGCIAITLGKRLPAMAIYACDVSEGALAVADRNAEELDAAVGFIRTDFLDRSQWAGLPQVRWLVSNPPYIPLKERDSMASHVVDAEPALALFVPDDDALIFYRALGEFAGGRIGPGAVLFAEVHEGLGDEVRKLLLGLGAVEAILRKDLQGKDRMIKAVW